MLLLLLLLSIPVQSNLDVEKDKLSYYIAFLCPSQQNIAIILSSQNPLSPLTFQSILLQLNSVSFLSLLLLLISPIKIVKLISQSIHSAELIIAQYVNFQPFLV